MIRTIQTGPHSYAQGELVREWRFCGDWEPVGYERRATIRMSDGTEVTGRLIERMK